VTDHAEDIERIDTLERELAEVTRQQAATVEVLEVIGDSAFDLGRILDTVIRNAVTLCRADAGQIWRLVGDGYRIARTLGGSEAYAEYLATVVIRPARDTVVGKVALERRATQLPDVLTDSDYWFPTGQRLGGFRTLLGVPMLHGDTVIGVLTVWRREVAEFDESQVDLLQTFAAQGAIAIASAQLFGEINEKNQALEIASKHKSEFLAHMSHELRTPLNAIIGFSEVLLERLFGEINEKQTEYLQDILNSGRHLLSLINDVLDVSKVEAGRMELELGSIPLRHVLEDSVVLLREQAAGRNQTVVLDIDDAIENVPGDERRIKQVVTNLVTNAVKFTPSGGRITVEAHRRDDEVLVSVADTGIGIAEVDQAAIFDAFQQIKSGPEPKPEGTGLGLTLSRQIVLLHGGRMWIESEVGGGSTFTFTLPLRTELVPQLPVPEAAAPVATGTTTLLVEDDDASINLLSLFVTEAGFDVAVARNGREGLELARSLRPAGIILDILLPGLDGWQFLAQAKADPELSNVPVIIVSMLDERGKGLALGAADYLVKPVGRTDLLDALARVLPLPSPATVLAIDDDPLALELVRTVLEPIGCTVLAAGNAEVGIALARTAVPDVVLLDLVMPEVDGFGVVERLKEDPATAGIPIVVLTSKTLTASDEELLRGRIAHVAQKAEFDRDALRTLIRRFAPARVT
jgi:signal transduction histidine kinase/CheY-like chemotaxis protein